LSEEEVEGLLKEGKGREEEYKGQSRKNNTEWLKPTIASIQPARIHTDEIERYKTVRPSEEECDAEAPLAHSQSKSHSFKFYCIIF